MTSTSLALFSFLLTIAPVVNSDDAPEIIIQAWYRAIESNSNTSISELTQKIPDVNLPTPSRKKTALMAAAAAGDSDLIRKLKTLGADPELRNQNNGTVLMYACWGGDLDATRELLETQRPLDLNSQASNGWTAVMMCAVKDRGPVTRLLLNKNADPNIADVYGWTPLMRAAYEGNLKSLHELLEFDGTRIDLTNFNGQTALHLAAAGKQKVAYQLLLSHGSDPRPLDYQGYSASEIARKQNITPPE